MPEAQNDACGTIGLYELGAGAEEGCANSDHS
jgi:hypothetical protein